MTEFNIFEQVDGVNLSISEGEILEEIQNQARRKIQERRILNYFQNRIWDIESGTGKRVKEIIMHTDLYIELTRSSLDIIELETYPSRIRQGIVGQLYGADVKVDKSLEPTEIRFNS